MRWVGCCVCSAARPAPVALVRVVVELRKQEQSLFHKFLGIEDRHLALVQAQFEAVKDRGLWFDISAFIGVG